MMKGKIGLIVVGYAPRELSQYIWFSIGEGAKFEAEVHKEKPMASPLVQGGLEIPIKVSVTWDEPEKLSILVAKVKEVEYPLTREYVNDSKNVLLGLGIEKDKDDDDGVETTMWNFRRKQSIMRTFKCYKNIFSFSCNLFNTKKRCFILIELVKRTLSDPSALDAFYYPRFFRYKKS